MCVSHCGVASPKMSLPDDAVIIFSRLVSYCSLLIFPIGLLGLSILRMKLRRGNVSKQFTDLCPRKERYLFHTYRDLHCEINKTLEAMNKWLWKYENHICEMRIKTWIWQRSDEHYSSSCENKAWKKKFRLVALHIKNSRSLRSLVRFIDVPPLVNQFVCTHFPWNNLYVSLYSKTCLTICCHTETL